MPPVDPDNEEERLSALYSYSILDTPPDGAFDRVTSLAAKFFNVPISLVSLVDEDRIWFKSTHGTEIEEAPRDDGLCASVIFSDEAYVVENAIKDPRVLSHPLVAEEFGLRFYAGVPLITHDGYRLGSMAIIDFNTRTFSSDQAAALHEFAGVIIEQMELRLSAREISNSITKLIKSSKRPDAREELITICAWTKKVRIGDTWYSFEEFLSEHIGASVTHGMHPEIAEQLRSETDHEPSSDS